MYIVHIHSQVSARFNYVILYVFYYYPQITSPHEKMKLLSVSRKHFFW